MTSEDDLQTLLARLRSKFVTGAPATAQALRTAGAAAETNELRQILHRLAGTAGVFGFTLIGDAAAELESRLASRPEAGTAIMIERLAAQLDECPDSSQPLTTAPSP